VGPAAVAKRLLESALDGELTDHLGYDKHDRLAAMAATPATALARKSC
jgi:hypothetical protein